MAAKKAATKATKTAATTKAATTKKAASTKKATTKKAAAAPKKPDNKAHFTANHRVIQKWAEERGGKPSTVKGTRRKSSDHAGILRIDFPGYSGEGTLKEISWDDFFAKFDEEDLALIYQNQTADGQPSRFCKFVSMETAEESGADEVGADGQGDQAARPSESEGEAAAPKKAGKSARKAKTTTNHRVIQKWVEERGGKPSTVKGTRRKGSDPAGLLRIDFPGYSGEGTLKEISWDDFFAKFDEENLVFLYQEQTASGQQSRFCKFVSMQTAAERAGD